MKWKKLSNMTAIRVADIPVLPFDQFRKDLIEQIGSQDKRVLALFVDQIKNPRLIYSILCDDSTSQLTAASASVSELKDGYHSMTPLVPSMHLFEREIFEETGIRPIGHPWLKPVRFPVNRANQLSMIENYPFYSMAGEQIHEVSVGPVHAGVIEPGHFRFMCHGELVYHLEIQLGYQHRNMEEILIHSANQWTGKTGFNPSLAEKIAGDTAIGHSMAYTGLIETMTETDCPQKAHAIRSIGLELERAAVHIGDLGAILSDIGFMMGSSVFGALRTTIINTTLAICGNRFGMGLNRTGGVNFDITPELSKTIRKNLISVEKKLSRFMNLTVLGQPSVLSRLEGTGTVPLETAKSIGMVGPAARASGLQTDVRIYHPFGNYRRNPARIITLEQGDVFARTYIRYVETLQSLRYIREQLDALEDGEIYANDPQFLPPDTLAVSMIEGWRGEIVHIGITGPDGKLARYKIKDPSFNNWYGLTLAVRDNGISDFPLCNKSFNLSYCGHDL